MRIDGRFDPKAWVQPQAEETVVSARVVEQRDEREVESAISESGDASANFTSELELSYAYTHATRTAATVTEVLEKTPDL
jgi:hypothetical protein